MRCIIALLFPLFIIGPAKGQGGFIQAYDLDYPGMTFHDVILSNDTLVLVGSALKEDYSRWGALLVKMDTSGNIISSNTYFHPDGDEYIFNQDYNIIKTTDGGYAFVGVNFTNQTAPVLFKVDKQGQVMFIQEYPDTSTFTKRHWNLVEFDRGYISMGVKQQKTDYKWDAFIMRTDHLGNKVWEIAYGEEEVYDRFSGLFKINDDRFLLTGSTFISGLEVQDVADLWSIPRYIIIDSSGQIVEEWEGEKVYAGTGGPSPAINQPHPAPDGGWVHTSVNSTVYDEESIAFEGAIVKRDSNFTEVWRTRFGQPTSSQNFFEAITGTPDGGWVAAGQYLERYHWSTQMPPTLNGWLAKVDAQGDSLWSRTDTVFYDPTSGSVNYLSAVVALPSGSIIACGYLNRYIPQPARSFGWIIKVDQHGCVQPGCNPTTDAVNLSPMIKGYQVYPNPASHYFHITSPENQPFQWRLLNQYGQELRLGSSIGGTAEVITSDLVNGYYYLQIRQGQVWLTKKLVVTK